MIDQVKCKCRHCDQTIAFPAADIGATVTCPNCQGETQLFRPVAPGGFPPGAAPQLHLNRAPALKPSKLPVEDSLESAGGIYFAAGCIGAVGFIAAAFLSITDERMTAAVVNILYALICIGQGWIIWMLFRGAGEIIRLLRQVARKE